MNILWYSVLNDADQRYDPNFSRNAPNYIHCIDYFILSSIDFSSHDMDNFKGFCTLSKNVLLELT